MGTKFGRRIVKVLLAAGYLGLSILMILQAGGAH